MLGFSETRLFIHNRKTFRYYSSCTGWSSWKLGSSGWKAQAALQWPAQKSGCPVVQTILSFGTPEKRKNIKKMGNCFKEMLLLLWRVVCDYMFGKSFPKVATTSPHMPHCRQNTQTDNTNQIGNYQHKAPKYRLFRVWFGFFFNLMCKNLPFLNVKLCSRAMPSNQWLYFVSPIVCIPGPFRRSIPCNHVGNWPMNKKEIPSSIHLGEEHVRG